MIPYKQLSLADIFSNCQDKFENDKPAFLSYSKPLRDFCGCNIPSSLATLVTDSLLGGNNLFSIASLSSELYLM